MSVNSLPVILIVEDDEDMNELLEEILLGLGDYRVIATLSGNEALEIIEREMPDLVFLDIMLEDISGTEVCRIIKGNPGMSHIPVIALTAIHENARKSHREIMESGVDGYIKKPFELAELKKNIDRFLERS